MLTELGSRRFCLISVDFIDFNDIGIVLLYGLMNYFAGELRAEKLDVYVWGCPQKQKGVS